MDLLYNPEVWVYMSLWLGRFIRLLTAMLNDSTNTPKCTLFLHRSFPDHMVYLQTNGLLMAAISKW